MDGFQEDLKNHYEQGWQDREYSIIKLLESIEDYPSGWDYNDPIKSVIDLIKEQD